eukprot:4314556-Lingulodinium_polyedra.AAC.1
MSFAAEMVARFINRAGIAKTTLRADGEFVVCRLAEMVRNRRTFSTQAQQPPKHPSVSINV